MLVGLARHDKALLYLSLLLRLLVLSIVLGPEETTCTTRTEKSYMWREITDITFLAPQRVSFVLRLRQSFPEDCARLKLSSARASQAGLKEMMTRRRVGDLVVRSYFQSTIVASTIAFAIASSEASLTS